MAGESSKPRFSPNEQAVLIALFTILALFTAILGLMVYSANTVCVGPQPCPALEGLSVLSTSVNSPTNATLQIINVGQRSAVMIAYYVKDASGTTYANTNWAGPTLQPNEIVS